VWPIGFFVQPAFTRLLGSRGGSLPLAASLAVESRKSLSLLSPSSPGIVPENPASGGTLQIRYAYRDAVERVSNTRSTAFVDMLRVHQLLLG
jgi:hypothetical protein